MTAALHTYIANGNGSGADFCQYLKNLNKSDKYNLLQKTTDVTLGTTRAVHQAALRCHTNVLEQMMSGLSAEVMLEFLTTQDKNGDTALSGATWKGHTNIVKYNVRIHQLISGVLN